MKPYQLTFVFLMVLFTFAYGNLPTEEMTSNSMGVGYGYLNRGINVDQLSTPLWYRAHLVTFQYAPIPSLLFTLGGGAGRIVAADNQRKAFDGNWSFTATGGLSFISPKALGFLSLTVGSDFYYFTSPRNHVVFSGGIINPYGGVILSFQNVFNIEAGVKGQYVDGNIEIQNRNVQHFSALKEPIHGYLQTTFYSKDAGLYVTAAVDASQKAKMDWVNGPLQSSFSIGIGFILRDQGYDYDND